MDGALNGGIHLEDKCYGITMHGNSIRNTVPAIPEWKGHTAGIWVQDSQHIQITSNYLDGNADAGVKFVVDGKTHVSHAWIHWNTIVSPTGGRSVEIPGVDVRLGANTWDEKTAIYKWDWDNI